MKNLKVTTRILVILLLIGFTACKKDKDEARPEPEPIKTEELLNYQIVVAFKSPADDMPARLFYFTRSGNEIMATMDGVQSRRIRAVKVVDNRFTFDSDDDGQIVYTFNLKRNEQGVVILEAWDYQNQHFPSVIIDAAAIWKSDFPGFKNKTFKGVNEPGLTLRFTEDSWTLQPVNDNNGTFYEIAPGAWKGKLDGHDYMGFSFYQDNDSKPSMALVREGSGAILAFQ